MTEFLDKIEYSGPPEHAKAWERFARKYTKDGSLKKSLATLNQLNAIAFAPDGVKTFLRESAQMSDEDKKSLKTALEDACLENSNLTRNPTGGFRPLNKSLTNAFIAQWVELERRFDLFPPSGRNRSTGITRAEEAALEAQKNQLLQTPEGGFIRNMLRLLNNGVMQNRITKMANWQKLEDPAYIDAGADKIFHYCLFLYNPFTQKKAAFTTYLDMALKRGLLSQTRGNTARRWQSTVSHLVNERLFSSTREPAAEDTLAHGEILNAMAALLPTLDPREQKVIKLRFGLEGSPRLTLKETGKEVGLTQERIRYIEQTALLRLRRALDSERPASELRLGPEATAAFSRSTGNNRKIMEFKQRLRGFFIDADGETIPISDITAATQVSPARLSQLMGAHNITNPRKASGMSDNLKTTLANYLRGMYPEEWASRFEQCFDEFKEYLGKEQSQQRTEHQRGISR